MPKKDKELPLLPSTVKEWKEKVTKLQQEKDQLYASVLRRVNGIIVRSNDLTEEQKSSLLSQIWSEQT
jgi:autonomous glycyl radical cofactor GrcA